MEPVIQKGDAVFVTEKYKEYSLNDIVTFSFDQNRQSETITHRIVRIRRKEDIAYYQTQGDNNPIPDAQEITKENIVGKVTFVIPKIGNLVLFSKSVLGIIVLGVIPTTIALTLYFKDFADYLQNKVAKDKKHKPKSV
jgi:signal peptidase I